MKHFLIGVIAGFLIGLSICLSFRPVIQYYLGNLLDEDLVYLKGGTAISGKIIQENADSLLIRTKSDSMLVPRSRCAAIYRNAPAYYMRTLM